MSSGKNVCAPCSALIPALLNADFSQMDILYFEPADQIIHEMNDQMGTGWKS